MEGLRLRTSTWCYLSLDGIAKTLFHYARMDAL